jgi:hypothetical protein
MINWQYSSARELVDRNEIERVECSSSVLEIRMLNGVLEGLERTVLEETV